MRKPWFRKQTGYWYVTHRGEQIRLSRDETDAFKKWHTLCETIEREATKNYTFEEVFKEYFQYGLRQVRNKEMSQKTLEDYLWYLDMYLPEEGQRLVNELEPRHLTAWLNTKSWGTAGQRNAITAIQRVLNWAEAERWIDSNPLAKFRKPPQNRHEHLVSAEDHRKLIQGIRDAGGASARDKQFQLVVMAIRHTGGRPQDVARARVEYVNAEVTKWTLPEHKRKRTSMQPKVVYLSPCLQTITRMLMQGRSSGPLFQGRIGELTVNAIGNRITRLKKKLDLPDEMIAYSYRHTYITDCLTSGIDTATVAELVGTSIQMIDRHYGHLSQKGKHLEDSVARVKRTS